MNAIRQVWERLTLNQRLLIGSVGGALVLAMVMFMVWAREPDYTVLYANLDPGDAGEIIDQLRAEKIPYRLEDGGRTVLVPSRHVYESRLDLAVNGLPESGANGYEIFDGGTFGLTDFVQKLNYRRALEGEISRTIQSLSEVRAARVHIVIPEESLFAEEQKEATASIVVRLKGPLNTNQVAGIVRLVGAGVEGLKPENVTVVDTYGNILSKNAEDGSLAAATSTQLDLRASVESHLRKKVVQMLEGVLGNGKVAAQINVDLDFEQIERTTQTYDAENPAIRSEERIKGQQGEDDSKNESIVTNYEISKTEERSILPVGGIKKLTVAVLLDGTYATNDDGEREYVPRSDEEMNRLTGIIKTAIGFDDTRGDVLEVHNVAFDTEFVEEERGAISKADRTQFMYQVLNRVGQVLILLLLALMVRNFFKKASGAMHRQIEVVGQNREKPAVQRPNEEEKYLRIQQDLVQLAETRPAEVSQLVRAWLKED